MKKLLTLVVLSAFLAGAASASLFQSNQGKVAIVSLDGQITPTATGGLSPTGLTPEKVRELNSMARDRNVDAIIYEINSGGGAVVASKEIMRSIEAVEKPTVCRFRDVAASGAYLASLGCDRIVADSASITGSIGVKGSYLEFSGTLDKLGVEYVNITAGKDKDLASPYRNITERERELLKQNIDLIHEEFVGMVEEERNLSEEEVEAARTGQIFLGEEAKENGLVDELGGRRTAVESAEELTGKELSTVKVESTPDFSFLQLLTSDLSLDFFADQSSPIRAEWR